MIRLRLVHRLSLLLVSLTTLCIIAMAMLIAWNLRNGFGAFLAERDRQDLQEFADRLGSRLEANGTADVLRQGDLPAQHLLRDLLSPDDRQHRDPPPRPRPQSGPSGNRPPPPPPPPQAASIKHTIRLSIFGTPMLQKVNHVLIITLWVYLVNSKN